jgi:arylsulfatase A-like enzyme
MKVSLHAFLLVLCFVLLGCAGGGDEASGSPPNVVLVMADDMGWGQTGYYNHSLLKTPYLDDMAANGIRFDRFYAGAPNCSPTRATVMTGRSNDRTGVHNHGFALRRQEKTVAQAMQAAGYATGHFGKWHLNGLQGPGVPVLASDDHNPGEFGFDTWVSVTNFFDRDPLMSRQGEFVEFEGDSSEIVVDEALKFIGEQSEAGKPFFVVIWYGTPHSPFVAADEDNGAFAALDEKSMHHHGELVAMDRSIGTLRDGLRSLGVADNTLLWFNSDNGGLPEITPDTTGGLRGNKNAIYEGGLRVPAVIEWPAGIPEAKVTAFPAATMDIFPTLAEVVGLSESAMLQPIDGISLAPLFQGEMGRREKAIPFRHTDRAALVDNEYKILTLEVGSGAYELYNLEKDPYEGENLFEAEPEVAARMQAALEAWIAEADASQAGQDYPEKSVDPNHPERRLWWEVDEYQPYLEEWAKRPEYRQRLADRK